MGMMNGDAKVIRDRGYPPLPLTRNNDIIELEPDQRLITQRHTVEIKNWIRQRLKHPYLATQLQGLRQKWRCPSNAARNGR